MWGSRRVALALPSRPMSDEGREQKPAGAANGPTGDKEEKASASAGGPPSPWPSAHKPETPSASPAVEIAPEANAVREKASWGAPLDRFDPTVVERLLRLQWWDLSEEKIARFLPVLLSGEIASFLDRAEADAGA